MKSQGAHFEVDDAKVDEEARCDGLWALQTNTDLEPMVVSLAYKPLWMIEDLFRTTKSVLETRPVHHQTDRCRSRTGEGEAGPRRVPNRQLLEDVEGTNARTRDPVLSLSEPEGHLKPGDCAIAAP